MNIVKISGKSLFNKSYLPFVIFAVAIFLILFRVNFKLEADEGVWFKILKDLGSLGFIKYYTFSWQPRIFSMLGFLFFRSNIVLWRLLSTFFATVGMFCISKMCYMDEFGEKQFKINIFICCLFFFIAPYVITSGMMWVAGSLNYLWPTVVMLIALIPFIYAIYEKAVAFNLLYIVILIATVCACYNEQTIAVLVCFGGLSIVFLFLYRRSIPKLLIFQYILIVLNSGVFLYLSKYGDRITQELHYYPDFRMLSIVDKIFQGVNWTNFHFINSSNLLFLIISVLVFVNIYQKNKLSIPLHFFSGIPMLYNIYNIVPFNVIMKNININNSNAVYYTATTSPYSIDDVLYNNFFNTMLANPGNFNHGIKELMPTIVGFAIILYVVVLLYIAFDRKEDKFVIIILYFAALASGYVLGFSPTIFASGSRIFYVSNILLIFIAAKLFVQSIKSGFIYSRLIKCSFVLFAVLLWLQFVLYFPSAILWL